MSLTRSQIDMIVHGLSFVSEATTESPSYLVETLTGVAWDEEEAGRIIELIEDSKP